MGPEVGAESPLWTDDGVMVDLDQLPISAELQSALELWADRVWSNLPPSSEWETQGRTLHQRLMQELGPDYAVVFEP
jgi:hypothetical protein